eukprot:2590276-Rhodomonas_salina.2
MILAEVKRRRQSDNGTSSSRDTSEEPQDTRHAEHDDKECLAEFTLDPGRQKSDELPGPAGTNWLCLVRAASAGSSLLRQEYGSEARCWLTGSPQSGLNEAL